MNLGPKSQYNEFVESVLENWVLMNQITNKVNFDDKKMKLDWFNLKKIILNTVKENQFLCISLMFDYKFQFLIVTVFLS